MLNGPRGDQIMPLVQKNLQGKVSVILRENSCGQVIYEDCSRCAGVEYGGEQMPEGHGGSELNSQTRHEGRATQNYS